jgi:hypothetical protein
VSIAARINTLYCSPASRWGVTPGNPSPKATLSWPRTADSSNRILLGANGKPSSPRLTSSQQRCRMIRRILALFKHSTVRASPSTNTGFHFGRSAIPCKSRRIAEAHR